MVRPVRSRQTVFRKRTVSGLKPLLKRRLVVGSQTRHSPSCAQLIQGTPEESIDECLSCGQATIEIDRCDDRLERVSNQRRLLASTRFLFATTQQQVLTQIQLLSSFVSDGPDTSRALTFDLRPSS